MIRFFAQTIINNEPHILEALMLTCFGASWPISIIKTIKSKSVKGVSSTFYPLILIGYISGTIWKHISNSDDPVIYCYLLNATMVFTQIVLYLYYASSENSLVRRFLKPKNRRMMIWILSQTSSNLNASIFLRKIRGISIAGVLLLVIWILVPSISYGSQNDERQKAELILFDSLHLSKGNSPEKVMNIVQKAGGRFIQSTTIKGYKADIYDMSGHNRDMPNAIAVYVRDEFRPQQLAEFTFIFNRSNTKSMKSKLYSLIKSKSDLSQISKILVKENGEPDKGAGEEGTIWNRDNGQSYILLTDCSHSKLFKDDFSFASLIEYRNAANYRTIEKNGSILNPTAQSTVLSPPAPTNESEITNVSD